MARHLTIEGALLILLGLIGYAISGGASVTALIPAFFGLPIIVCGKMDWRIAGIILTGLGLIGASRGLVKLPELLAGTAKRPLAIGVQIAMSLICLFYLVLLVRAVRKAD